jgi:Fuc2NAc and GlcNAc transferase
MTPFHLWLAAAGLLGTILFLALYIGWAKQAMVDTPNERSAHLVATPTGGGLVFLGLWLALMTLAGALVPDERAAAIALVPPVLLLMWLGWLDDRRPLSAALRFAVQIGCAALFLALWPWTVPSDAIFWTALPVALLYLVYSTNITNFMDGIDGIVALQALGFVAAVLLIDPATPFTLAALLLGAAMLGFLVYNRPAARLFMGDSGSAPIGLLLAAITLAYAAADWRAGLALLMMQGVFLCDSAVTLLRRALRRQNVTQAHSEHAYQHAKRRWGHARVSYGLFALTMLVQLPLALGVARQALPFWTAGLDFAALALLAAAFGAGTARTD